MVLQLPKLKNEVKIFKRTRIGEKFEPVEDYEKYEYTDETVWVFGRDREEVKFESFAETDDFAGGIYGDNIQSETFTTGTTGNNYNYFLTRIELWLEKSGTGANVTIEIREVDAAHKPTGALITTGTGTVGAAGYNEIKLSQAEIKHSTEYGIIIKTDGDAVNNVHWWGDNTTIYKNSTRNITNSTWKSSNNGTTWDVDGDGHKNFKIFGY